MCARLKSSEIFLFARLLRLLAAKTSSSSAKTIYTKLLALLSARCRYGELFANIKTHCLMELRRRKREFQQISIADRGISFPAEESNHKESGPSPLFEVIPDCPNHVA